MFDEFSVTSIGKQLHHWQNLCDCRISYHSVVEHDAGWKI